MASVLAPLRLEDRTADEWGHLYQTDVATFYTDAIQLVHGHREHQWCRERPPAIRFVRERLLRVLEFGVDQWDGVRMLHQDIEDALSSCPRCVRGYHMAQLSFRTEFARQHSAADVNNLMSRIHEFDVQRLLRILRVRTASMLLGSSADGGGSQASPTASQESNSALAPPGSGSPIMSTSGARTPPLQFNEVSISCALFEVLSQFDLFVDPRLLSHTVRRLLCHELAADMITEPMSGFFLLLLHREERLRWMAITQVTASALKVTPQHFNGVSVAIHNTILVSLSRADVADQRLARYRHEHCSLDVNVLLSALTSVLNALAPETIEHSLPTGIVTELVRELTTKWTRSAESAMDHRSEISGLQLTWQASEALFGGLSLTRLQSIPHSDALWSALSNLLDAVSFMRFLTAENVRSSALRWLAVLFNRGILPLTQSAPASLRIAVQEGTNATFQDPPVIDMLASCAEECLNDHSAVSAWTSALAAAFRHRPASPNADTINDLSARLSQGLDSESRVLPRVFNSLYIRNDADLAVLEKEWSEFFVWYDLEHTTLLLHGTGPVNNGAALSAQFASWPARLHVNYIAALSRYLLLCPLDPADRAASEAPSFFCDTSAEIKKWQRELKADVHSYFVALNSRGILQGLMATSSSVSLVGPLLNLWSVIQRDDSAYRQLVTRTFECDDLQGIIQSMFNSVNRDGTDVRAVYQRTVQSIRGTASVLRGALLNLANWNSPKSLQNTIAKACGYLSMMKAVYVCEPTVTGGPVKESKTALMATVWDLAGSLISAVHALQLLGASVDSLHGLLTRKSGMAAVWSLADQVGSLHHDLMEYYFQLENERPRPPPPRCVDVRNWLPALVSTWRSVPQSVTAHGIAFARAVLNATVEANAIDFDVRNSISQTLRDLAASLAPPPPPPQPQQPQPQQPHQQQRPQPPVVASSSSSSLSLSATPAAALKRPTLAVLRAQTSVETVSPILLPPAPARSEPVQTLHRPPLPASLQPSPRPLLGVSSGSSSKGKVLQLNVSTFAVQNPVNTRGFSSAVPNGKPFPAPASNSSLWSASSSSSSTSTNGLSALLKDAKKLNQPNKLASTDDPNNPGIVLLSIQTPTGQKRPATATSRPATILPARVAVPITMPGADAIDPAKRMEREIDRFYKTVLHWKPEAILGQGNAEGPSVPLQKPTEEFASVDDYIKAYEPLFWQECKASMKSVDGSDFAFGRPGMREFKVAVDGKTSDSKYDRYDMTIHSSSQDLAQNVLANDDLLRFFVMDQGRNVVGECVMVLDTIHSLNRQVLVRCRAVQLHEPWTRYITATSTHQVYIQRINSLTTALREFRALMTVPDIRLKQLLLSPRDMVAGLQDRSALGGMEHLNARYNSSQIAAIRACCERRKGFTLIQGPPGTGKTSTLMGTIGALLSSQTGGVARVLVCAPSNTAVDEIVRRLIKEDLLTSTGRAFRPVVVRMGASGNAINADVRSVWIDNLVDEQFQGQERFKRFNESQTSKDDQMNEIQKKIDDISNEVKEKDVRKRMFTSANRVSEAEDIEDDIRELLEQRNEQHKKLTSLQSTQQAREINASKVNLRKEILKAAQVVCCTLSGAGHDAFGDVQFPVVIIDEAAQAVEMSTLIPLRFGCDHCILLGDPKQLPPTVFSNRAKANGYDRSLFERVQKRCPQSVVFLNTQYRMHPTIAWFPARHFYEGLLHDAPNMKLLRTEPFHSNTDEMFPPFAFINILGRESQRSDGPSISNPVESKLIVDLIYLLCSSYPDTHFYGRIGVITPYKQQMMVIRGDLRSAFGPRACDAVEVNTVDGFQGREKDIIILSCVRAPSADNATVSHGIGFFSDVRRMNVALTRARQSLWIVGHGESLERGDKNWGELVSFAKEHRFFHRSDRPHTRSDISLPNLINLNNAPTSTSTFAAATSSSASVSARRRGLDDVSSDDDANQSSSSSSGGGASSNHYRGNNNRDGRRQRLHY